MPYRFRRQEIVAAGVRRIANEQLERASNAVKNGKSDPHRTVHVIRQRCKKIRALLRLVEPQFAGSLQQENAFFRDAAGRLSKARDAQSLIECFDRLVSCLPKEIDGNQFDTIRRELKRRRNTVTGREGGVRRKLKRFRKRLREAGERIESWSLNADEFNALAGGFRKTYEKAHESLERAYDHPTAENFHEWRKYAKRHGYHSRLLRGLWPAMLDAWQESADQLGTLLGDEHDLALLRATVTETPGEFGRPEVVSTLIQQIDCRRIRLQTRARSTGLQLFAHDPGAVTGLFSDWWDIWRNGHRVGGRVPVRSPLGLVH